MTVGLHKSRFESEQKLFVCSKKSVTLLTTFTSCQHDPCRFDRPPSVFFTPRSQANDLAVLISRMQKNADQVEKNILQSEELLAVVRRDFRAVSRSVFKS